MALRAVSQGPHRAKSSCATPGTEASTSQHLHGARLRTGHAAADTASCSAPGSYKNRSTPLLSKPYDSTAFHPPSLRHQPRPPPSPHNPILATGVIMTLGGLATCAAFPDAVHAFEIQSEPSNALSLPTWAIHVSSVVEWVTAMGLFWKYAEVTGNPLWKGMTWGMLPSLGGAMCACVWHFFYNAPSLDFLVALQASLTIVGNATCWAAAYRLYQGSKEQQPTS